MTKSGLEMEHTMGSSECRTDNAIMQTTSKLRDDKRHQLQLCDLRPRSTVYILKITLMTSPHLYSADSPHSFDWFDNNYAINLAEEIF